MRLIERYQPAFSDPAVGDAVDAGCAPHDLPAAERGATVGELDERLGVVRLAAFCDSDRPSRKLSPEAAASYAQWSEVMPIDRFLDLSDPWLMHA